MINRKEYFNAWKLYNQWIKQIIFSYKANIRYYYSLDDWFVSNMAKIKTIIND